MEGPIIFSTMQENGYPNILFQNLRILGVKRWSIQTSDALAERDQGSWGHIQRIQYQNHLSALLEARRQWVFKFKEEIISNPVFFI